MLQNGYAALCDLALFEITDPRASRYWHVRMTTFEGREAIDLLPPELIPIFFTTEDDERSGLEQDRAYFAALHSDEFKRVCELLHNEFEPSNE
jgi:hypothetical protein